MALISEKDAEILRKEFSDRMVQPVKLLVFSQEMECQFCAETRQIAEELAGLSDKISVHAYDFMADRATVEEYAIDKIPAIALLRVEEGRDRDFGIRIYGIPSGYEFTTLIEDLWDVSSGSTDLKPKTKQSLAKVEKPVHIQVFVTPT